MRKLITAGMAVAMLAVIPATSMASPAKDTTIEYVGGTCADSGPRGSVDVNKGIATINVPDSSSYGVIRAYTKDLKVKDIKTLSFKSLSSAGGGMVYMQIITDQGNRIKYTPAEQTPPLVPEPGIGSWYTHNPMTSGVRDGMPEVNDSAPTETWAQAVSKFPNDTVNRVAITAGCSLGHGTVQIDRMQVNNSVIGF